MNYTSLEKMGKDLRGTPLRSSNPRMTTGNTTTIIDETPQENEKNEEVEPTMKRI